MSFPRYPEYKDSGVEWLGAVPKHWDVTALKRGFDVTLGKMLQPDTTGPDDELLPYLRAANIQWDGIDSTDIKQMWLSKRDLAQLRLEYGDLLVSEGGDVGRSCMWAAELEYCYFQNSVNRVRARDGHSNRYLYYWMATIKGKGYIDVLCNKSTIAHFTAEKVAAVPVPFPPTTEQTKIAAFLDHETAKIDALVAEQRRLMELLKEKRQAVISNAVTRGLNPDAPMKPSGVEWLGGVPAHWEVVPLRWSAKCCSGDGLSSSEVESIGDDEHIVQVIGGNGLMGFTDQKNIDHSLLAVGRVGALCGNVHLVHPPAWITDNAIVLDPDSSIFNLQFLSMALRSRNLNDIASKTAQPLITGTQVGDQRIPCPPLLEQEAIAVHLTEETAKLDILTTEAQHAIDLLQERRTALISAAVTGQIDVRGIIK